MQGGQTQEILSCDSIAWNRTGHRSAASSLFLSCSCQTGAKAGGASGRSPHCRRYKKKNQRRTIVPAKITKNRTHPNAPRIAVKSPVLPVSLAQTMATWREQHDMRRERAGEREARMWRRQTAHPSSSSSSSSCLDSVAGEIALIALLGLVKPIPLRAARRMSFLTHRIMALANQRRDHCMGEGLKWQANRRIPGYTLPFLLFIHFS